MTGGPGLEQLTLLEPDLRKADVNAPDIANVLPVAEVLVDVPHPHLDRTFDYLVPASLSATAVPGVRVKVRFAGSAKDGFVVNRRDRSDHARSLDVLRSVVSPLPVLTPTILDVCQRVAQRYAGTTMDVLRLALPRRHQATEKRYAELMSTAAVETPEEAANVSVPFDWDSYHGGEAFRERVNAGQSPRAAWAVAPDREPNQWARGCVDATLACAASGRTAIIVAPDTRDVAVIESALRAAGLSGVNDRAWRPHTALSFARLVAEDGTAPRYRSFLAALHGHARIVIGTRSAVFAPLPDLGLLAVWDDGDDLHQERRAPYWHTREVAALRAQTESTALLLAGFARSCETQLWVEGGWCREVSARRDVTRARMPLIEAPTAVDLAVEGPSATAMLPSRALRMVREGLERGPVLVQVPRAGYVPLVACGGCREIARCSACHGPLEIPGVSQQARCRWCGRLETSFSCASCGSTHLRSVRVGSNRTAEELGRAFPHALVIVSGRGADPRVLDSVTGRPAIVVATPGAEPRVADGTYAAALLLDAAAMTSRPDLRAGEESLRRWLNASSLVAGREYGGRVTILGDGAPGATQALVRWDASGYARRELQERSELGLPPTTRVATVTGTRQDLAGFRRRLVLPAGAEVLGPVALPSDPSRADAEETVRMMLRVPRAATLELSKALKAAAALRAAHKDGPPVRIQIDPGDFT